MTTSIWKTIEMIPDLATDTLDWRTRLSDCWKKAEYYLPETSRFVDQVSCPYPGGEHCPRHVVRHFGGAVRAVCGDPAKFCDALELTSDDIRIRELDRRKLLADIASALALTPAESPDTGARVVHVGDHAISAGRGFPVFASFAGRRSPLSPADVIDLGRRHLPLVLLVTSLRVINADAITLVRSIGGRVLTFDECLQFASRPKRGLVPSRSPAAIFAPEIAVLTDGNEVAARPVIELPVGARWGDLRFAFISEEVLNISYRKQPPKRIEPDLLGMKDERNGKATRQWRLLLVCAALGGALPRSFPVQTIKGQRLSSDMIRLLGNFERGYDRQRQLLAAALKARFGIEEDPFAARGDCFEAEFASGLKQGRADQRARNFADEN